MQMISLLASAGLLKCPENCPKMCPLGTAQRVIMPAMSEMGRCNAMLPQMSMTYVVPP